MSSLSAAIGEFGLDFFKQELRHSAEDNIIFSPAAIAAGLAMILYGARSDTATQMEKVLHLKEAPSATPGDSPAAELERNVCRLTAAGSLCERPGGIHFQFQALLSQLNKPTKNYGLNIANRLYAAIGFDFPPHYLHVLKELYHADLEKVDFAKETEKTREQINSWMESQSHVRDIMHALDGEVKDFYPLHHLSPESVLLLANALYFKGKWGVGFKKEDTKEAPFQLNKNETRNVPMMVQTGNFKTASIKDPPLQVLELPYEGKDLSMFILLPKNDDFNLKKLMSCLTYKKLAEWTDTSKMQPGLVNVQLPRFKLGKKIEFKKSLEAMGMTLPFDASKADLSGMSQQPLAVSQIIHQTFVEVSEEGTEAASLTSIVRMTPTLAEIPAVFKADCPFLFIIKAIDNNLMVLIGHFDSP